MVLDVKLNKVFKDTFKDDSTVLQTSACSLCKSESLVTDTDSGEVICSKCGMVISEKTQETRPESRTFPNTTEVSKKRARTGMPNSLASADMGLSTVIGKSDRDASGNKNRTIYAFHNASIKNLGLPDTGS